jgi:SAM-dependent methyltransferase
MDWNSDAVIRNCLSVLKAHGGKATVFATHKTEAIAGFSDCTELALHPNFLPGSTHGETFDKVIDHCFGFCPNARTFRSHSYFDNQVITEKMAGRGIRYDANICLYRESNLRPLRHCHIEARIPSWLDDNIHWYHKGSWQFTDLRAELETPGLKVINFHPPTVALNASTREWVDALRPKLFEMDDDDVAANIFDGVGPRTFLIDLLDWIKGRHRLFHFSEIYQLTRPDRSSVDGARSAGAQDVSGRPAILGDYAKLSEDERMARVRDQYNSMSAKGRYATSRDYNNRELELDLISSFAEVPRILDLGCGNGYTALTLASQFDLERIVGVDFSETMVAGAYSLLEEEFTNKLRVVPEFVCANAFDFIARTRRGEFDLIVTERLVVNLPNEGMQLELINDCLDRLEIGGRLLLVEGSAQGFEMLNQIREKSGLAIIPDRYQGNESSNKLDERAIEDIVAQRKDVTLRSIPNFSFYSIMSKVLHPLIVQPAEPKFTSIINDRARDVQAALNALDVRIGTIGAAAAWVFEKTVASGDLAQ